MGFLYAAIKRIFASFLFSTGYSLVFILLSLIVFSYDARAQVSVSPDFKIPEIVVNDEETSGDKKADQKNQEKSTGAAASSQQGPSVEDPDALVAISPTSVVTPIENIASSVSVITSKEIQDQQRRTASEALKTVPGINVVQTGGAGGLTSIFIRGTNPNHVKVLIDGIDASDPSNANRLFDFGQLTTWDIERIEVLRGPQSGLYGADALGGVISITTKKGEGPPIVSTTIEGGSFGTFNQSAGFSGSEKNFNYSGSVSHLRSTDTPVTPLYLLPPGQKRNNDYYDNWTYSTKLGVDVSKSLSLNTVARYTDSTSFFTEDDYYQFPPVPNADRSDRSVQQLYTRSEAVLDFFNGDFQNFFAIAYSNNNNSTVSPIPINTTANDGDRIKVDWRSVAKVAQGQILIFGLEDQKETLNTSTIVSIDYDPITFYPIDFTKAPVNAEEENRAAYVEIQSEIAKRFFMAANLRYDSNSNFGDVTTWRIAPALLIPGSETKLKGSIGTGFKAPSLTDRFVDYPGYGYVANRNLQPEKNLGFDVGFEQPLLNNKVNFGATYFQNDLTDLIQYVCLSRDPISGFCLLNSLDNVDSATTLGVESFASAKISDNLSLRGDYTFTHAVNNETGQELLRRPQNKATLTALWIPIEKLTFSGVLIYTGDWLDVGRYGEGPLTAAGYTVVNIAADYKINENTSLFGRIDNLFNVQYEEPTGFERPGIGAYMGMRFTGKQ